MPEPLEVQRFLKAYRVNELHARGLNGAGTTVVIPAIDQFDPADIAAFNKENNLPRAVIHEQGTKPQEYVGELTMDISIVHAVAPQARIEVLYLGPSMGTMASEITNASALHPGAIWSWSLGLCETQVTSTSAQGIAAAIEAGSRGGAAHFAASGDSAGYDCFDSEALHDPPTADMVGVIFPASAPQTIAVGGTQSWVSADGTMVREFPWYDSSTMLGAGGGDSVVFPGRTVPDVSADADPGTGMLFTFDGDKAAAGGTSASAPFWAGLGALVQQDLAKKGAGPIGPFRETVMQVGQRYHATVFRHPALGGIASEDPKEPFDAVTGWGSPDAVAFVDAVARVRGRP